MEGSEPTPESAFSGRTRVIQLDAGQERRREGNTPTMFRPGALLPPDGAPFEALFFVHYRAIRTTCRPLSDPGVAVIAVHIPTCRLAGRLWLRAQPGRPATAIIGRHSQADLLLSDDAALSLRHLALVLHPLRSWDGHEARFTVLDLRSGRAFHDEEGRLLESVRCEGPALLTCGDYALYFLQTGDATDWPPLAVDAWSMLPERVYLDERDAEPDRWQRRAARYRARWPDDDCAKTRITAIRGPVRAEDELLRDGERALGAVHVVTEQSARRIEVGPLAASRGILLGRYSRCDASDLFEDEALSRTHLLLLRVDGKLYAIDTASTVGSYIDRGPHQRFEFRVLALESEANIVLADGAAAVRWYPAD